MDAQKIFVRFSGNEMVDVGVNKGNGVENKEVVNPDSRSSLWGPECGLEAGDGPQVADIPKILHDRLLAG